MAEQAYFNQFPKFAPDPQATLIENFRALAKSRRWVENSKRYTKERREYMIALADTHIGSIERAGAAEKLAGLQGLCGELRVSPVPTSITQCRKELKQVHICIVDLIDSRRLGNQVRVFSSYRDLQEHVTTEKHFFPKELAKEKADGLLKVLMRTMSE